MPSTRQTAATNQPTPDDKSIVHNQPRQNTAKPVGKDVLFGEPKYQVDPHLSISASSDQVNWVCSIDNSCDRYQVWLFPTVPSTWMSYLIDPYRVYNSMVVYQLINVIYQLMIRWATLQGIPLITLGAAHPAVWQNQLPTSAMVPLPRLSAAWRWGWKFQSSSCIVEKGGSWNREHLVRTWRYHNRGSSGRGHKDFKQNNKAVGGRTISH